VTEDTASIVAFITHARAVPAPARSQFAELVRAMDPAGRLIIETCHRVEVYLAGRSSADRARLAAHLPPGGSVLDGEAAIRHAVAMAVGRDSVVVGEDQVLHQARGALEAARTAGTLDPVLERLFALALRAGRRARSWRQGPTRSLADVALEAIERQVGPLRGRDVLVVGAGRMGRLAVRAAAAAAANIVITSRSAGRAAELATAAGAHVEPFDPGPRIGRFAAILVALGGAWPLEPASIDALAGSSTGVVDLSVPAAVPERLSSLLGPRLVTADDLAQADLPDHTASDGSRARLDGLIDLTTAEFLVWLEGHDRRTAADALVRRVDLEREAELADLWRRLPDLEPETRATIEGMSRHLAERLLREPLERLRADVDGRHERAVRDLWAL
jgi:glutamyl-tRNA reductase